MDLRIRHGSEKCLQAAAKLEDVLDALDAVVKVLYIYCEANDVLKIPPISLDPISEQINDNCQSLDNLNQAVKALQEQLSMGGPHF